MDISTRRDFAAAEDCCRSTSRRKNDARTANVGLSINGNLVRRVAFCQNIGTFVGYRGWHQRAERQGGDGQCRCVWYRPRPARTVLITPACPDPQAARPPHSTETIFIAENFHARRAKSFRAEKSFHDHGPGRPGSRGHRPACSPKGTMPHLSQRHRAVRHIQPWARNTRCAKGRRPVPHDEERASYLLQRVGVTGFEPATSSSRTKRATKLRHTPL